MRRRLQRLRCDLLPLLLLLRLLLLLSLLLLLLLRAALLGAASALAINFDVCAREQRQATTAKRIDRSE